MKVNVTCEKHNVRMNVVRGYTSRGQIEVTVEPCSECINEIVTACAETTVVSVIKMGDLKKGSKVTGISIE